jgi:sporulation protein YlmC with PRC-barrel domain
MAATPETRPTQAIPDEQIDPLKHAHGRRVVDPDGIEIGEVEEVFADPHTRRVRFLRVAAGGILGVGKAFSLIPVGAIVESDDERILVDLDPDRLVGSPSYLSLGQPRWDIPPETPVHSTDGKDVGKVVDVHPGFLFVEKGIYFSRDLYIPNDAIATYDGHEVTLRFRRDEIPKQHWDEAPPTLVRVESGFRLPLRKDEPR